MKQKILLPLTLLLLSTQVFSQVKIGNNVTSVNANSLLEMESTNQGFVPPRLSLTSTSSSSPLSATLLAGTLVYNTNASVTGGNGVGFYYWDGSKWNAVLSASSTVANAWGTTGNYGTTPGTNFIGTTDGNPLVFKVNNVVAGYISNTGSTQWSVYLGSNAGNYPNNNQIGTTALGGYSLANNTTGQTNTAVGFTSLQYNTTGSNNTALGNSAGLGITTGSNNTVLGANAIAASPYANTATGNTAVGYNTISFGGNYNSGVGFQALSVNNNSANYNTGMGYNALVNSTTGSNNTAFGSNALTTNTTGSNNMGLGYYANVTSAALTNATAIGYYAKVSASNSLVLGDTVLANQVNVGIGTAAPRYKLHVVASSNPLYLGGVQSGTIADSILTISSGVVRYLTPGSLLTAANVWATTGNTGTTPGTNFIGTTDNNGLVFKVNNLAAGFIDPSSSGAMYLGLGAGNYATSTGQYNTAVGYQTLTQNKTGGYNTALGYQAGYKNTVANNNVAVGYQAQFADSSGTDNTGVGYLANYSNKSGLGNTSVGSSAGFSNVSGTGNSAFGFQALTKNTTGNNSAFGFQAMFSNTTGTQNTGIGNVALFNNTTGYSNTAIGYAAIWANKTGVFNTALGNSSLAANTAGTGNTAVGANALVNSTTGYGNTALGDSALTTNTTGSNNMALGYYANVTGAALTNATAIGYYAKVSASNSLVLGDTVAANQVNVGIGTAAPQYKLHVVATGNPLYLGGVQSGTTADSILTINSGVVRNVSPGRFGWSTSGNSGTTPGTNFIGTTDAKALVFKVNNTPAGYISTESGSSGYQSLYMGINAGNYPNNTGFQNTVLGADALAVNTGGQINTAVGALSLNSSTTGSNNTAVGALAGYAITTGINNTLIGTSAMGTTGSSAATASYNTAVGQGTIGNGGNYNSATGYYALGSNNNGANYNTGMGYYALAVNSTGNNNTAFGTYALYGNTSGSNNMGLGYWANVTTFGLTNATAIGYNAKVSASNSMVLGDTVAANQVNVGIGTAAPQYKLHVVASSNPLYLGGVQSGTTADSILTINSGVVRYLNTSRFLATGSAWGTTGNSGTTPGTNFIGTTDANDLVVKTNGNERMRVFASGNVGIGTSTRVADAALSVNGHLQSQQTTAPTYTAGTAAVLGSTGSASINHATDVAGNISITAVAGASAAGGMVTVTFNTTYTTAPIVMLTPTSAASAGLAYYVVPTTTGFTVYNVNTLSANTYTWSYSVIETQ